MVVAAAAAAAEEKMERMMPEAHTRRKAQHARGKNLDQECGKKSGHTEVAVVAISAAATATKNEQGIKEVAGELEW